MSKKRLVMFSTQSCGDRNWLWLRNWTGHFKFQKPFLGYQNYQNWPNLKQIWSVVPESLDRLQPFKIYFLALASCHLNQGIFSSFHLFLYYQASQPMPTAPAHALSRSLMIMLKVLALSQLIARPHQPAKSSEIRFNEADGWSAWARYIWCFRRQIH